MIYPVDLVQHVALSVVATSAALVVYWRLCQKGTHAVFLGRSLLAIGWTILSLRMWLSMLCGYPISIHPLSLVAISLIGGGTVLIHVGPSARRILD